MNQQQLHQSIKHDKIATILFQKRGDFPINIKDDHRFDQYIKILKQNGLQVWDPLQCGTFQLKNGMQYCGLYTKQQLKYRYNSQQSSNGQQVTLVSVSPQLLLTSFKAQTLIPQLTKIFDSQKQFYHSGPIWQDRILVTFLLYILQAPAIQDNIYIEIWKQMAGHFSKQIDILSQWPEEELDKFVDPSILNSAKLQKKTFEEEWQQFKQIRDKYTQIFNEKDFSYEMYRWIYTHAVSRCFGSYMNCTYFTPFCQFFNHNCVHVSYRCLTKQQDCGRNQVQNIPSSFQNQHENKGQYKDDNNEEENEDEEIENISEQSNDSNDYIQEGDYYYHEVPTYLINWTPKKSHDLPSHHVAELTKKHSQLLTYVETNLMWKGFSLLYIGELIEKANIVLSQFMAARKSFEVAIQEFEWLSYHAAVFRKKVKQQYESMGCKYVEHNKGIKGKVRISEEGSQKVIQEKKQQGKRESVEKQIVEDLGIRVVKKESKKKRKLKNKAKIQQMNPDVKNEEQKGVENKEGQKVQNNYIKTHKPPDKDYIKFIMQFGPQPVCKKANNKVDVHFGKNREIYFEYGRLSNRTLLLRYGFCLEDNTYQHVWIRKIIYKEIGQYPDMFNKLKQYGLPVTYQLKLKPYTINTQLITFIKLQKWKMYFNSNVNKDMDDIFSITNIHTECMIIWDVVKEYWHWFFKYTKSDQSSALSELLQKEQFQEQYINQQFDILEKLLGQLLVKVQNIRQSHYAYFRAVYYNEKLKILAKHIYISLKVILILQSYAENTSTCTIKAHIKKYLSRYEEKKMIWLYLKKLSPFVKKK